MAFAPDGRLFVCQQGGSCASSRTARCLPTPFVTLTVDSTGERGLLGVAFDPDFATNHFVYVYYTVADARVHNRVSRFTANGDVAVAGSEVVLLDLDDLSSATNHNGGAHALRPGRQALRRRRRERQRRQRADARQPARQDAAHQRRRHDPDRQPVLRHGHAARTARSGRSGLRNPFTFAFQPGTGRMFINDVGQRHLGGDRRRRRRRELRLARPPRARPRTHASARPLYAYATAPAPTGCAITGGAFYNPPAAQFPSDYVGDYFFADYCGGWIRKLDPSNNSTRRFRLRHLARPST